MKKVYLQHLASSKDLETTYEAIRAGFVALALEKNRRATPFVAQARALKVTAAGVSDKAANHLQDSDRQEAILGLIRNFLEPAGTNFVEELVFRFLLTRGDTLGGSMRNIGGFMAQCKLTRSLIAHLRNAGKSYRWLPSDATEWASMPEDDADIELHLRGLNWRVGSNSRTLIYNLTVPFLRNNVDMCLFNCATEALSKDTYKSASSYIAVGELKGGIDPAGADEHWKTARTALGRIHSAFAKHNLKPKTFFIGAAIEAKMATEIWAMLQGGELDNAANLTEDDQITAITNWLCSL